MEETRDLTVIEKPGNQASAQPKQFMNTLNRWLMRWRDRYSIGREPINLTPSIIADYAESLRDLSVEQLDAACGKANLECRFFPQPIDIRCHVTKTEAAAEKLLAEAEWSRVLKYLDWYDPDTGTNKHDPPLPERTARATGSINALWHCSREELIWQKKGFLERYERLSQVEDGQKFLSDGMAEKLLRQLGEKPKQLAG